MEIIARPDFSANSSFPFVQIQKIYSCILIPLDFLHLDKIKNDTKIILLNSDTNKRLNQSIVFDHKEIILNDYKYYAIYIAPGIGLEYIYSKLSIVINNETYPLNIGFTKKNIPQLIIGQIILHDNYLYRFHTNDDIQLFANNEFISGKLYDIKNRFNYYSPNRITSILDILSTENILLNHFIHKNLDHKIYIRSLTTKQNYQLGSIVIKKSHNHIYSVYCTNTINNKTERHIFKNRLEINNLNAGKYILKIVDQNETIHYNDSIDVPVFVDSEIEQRSSLSILNRNYNQELIKST